MWTSLYCVLLFGLATVELGCCDCSSTNCRPMFECPSRQVLLCALENAKAAGTLDMRQIVFDPVLRPLFGNMPGDLASIPIEIRNGVFDKMEGVETLLRELGYFFRNTIDSTCLIPVRDDINSLVEGSVDTLLDIYHTILIRHHGRIPECPNRPRVQLELTNALASGSLNVIGMIQHPWYQVAMFELPGKLAKFLSDLNTGQVVEIKKISETMAELRVEFIDTLNAGCYILVRDDLEELIHRGFEDAYENYADIFLQRGGPLPLNCPNRNGYRSAIITARQTGTWDVITLIRSATFKINSEMQTIRKNLGDMQNGIRLLTINQLSQVLSTIQQARNDFLFVLQDSCKLWVLDDVYKLIDDGFDTYEETMITFLSNRGGNIGLARCPRRQLIISILKTMENLGTVNILTLLGDRRLSVEFQTTLQDHQRLVNEIRTRAVTDRRTIFERIEEIGDNFRQVLVENCSIEVESNLENLIQSFLDKHIEAYCAL